MQCDGVRWVRILLSCAVDMAVGWSLHIGSASLVNSITDRLAVLGSQVEAVADLELLAISE